jgi:non-specific serine/threonine protein kinase
MFAADLTLERRELERTTNLLKESLRHYVTLRAAWAICIVLEHMAVVAVELGLFQRAARLFGAEEALRDTVGSAMNARWRAVYEGSLASARAALGEETFAPLWTEGRAMTREQVIGYALEDAAPA